jgi:hypothetical protein
VYFNVVDDDDDDDDVICFEDGDTPLHVGMVE